MLSQNIMTTCNRYIASGCFALAAALSVNTYAAAELDTSNLYISYLSASSSSELLARAENRGLDFLNVVEAKADPEFCNKQVQGGLKVFETLVKMIPGTGNLSDLIKLASGAGVASTCRGAGGLGFTWDEIMKEVDRRIDIALSDLQRKQMRDLFGYFSLEFESRTDRLLLAEVGELSQTDILILITELSNIVGDIEQAETLFGAGNEWTQVSFLPHLYALKYNIHLVLVKLYSLHTDLDQTAFDHLNLQMEKSRIRAIRGIVSANDHYAKFVSNYNFANASYQFEKSRSGFYSTWRRNYKIRFFPANGDEVLLNSSCNGNPCNGITANTWYNRRDRNLRDTAEAYEEMWSGLFASRDDTYRDFVDSVNYFKGQQVFFVAGSKYNNSNRLYSSHCLRPALLSDGITGVESAVCSFGEHQHSDIEIPDRENLIDSWRVHDKTGLVINEATGLCLDLAENKKDLQLSPCVYTLDPEREERSTQEWAILEHGLLINRNTGECLNTPEETKSDISTWGSRVEMQMCDTNGIKTRDIDLGVATFPHKFAQAWQLLSLQDCQEMGACSVSRSMEFNLPTRRVQGKKRHVLPADGVARLAHAARLETTIPGFTDTGFVSFAERNDRAKWQDLEIIAGRYRLTVVYQGVQYNEPTYHRLKLDINDKPVSDELYLTPIIAGEMRKAEFDIEISDFGKSLAIRSFSGDGNYLIDKLILTPISEE